MWVHARTHVNKYADLRRKRSYMQVCTKQTHACALAQDILALKRFTRRFEVWLVLRPRSHSGRDHGGLERSSRPRSHSVEAGNDLEFLDSWIPGCHASLYYASRVQYKMSNVRETNFSSAEKSAYPVFATKKCIHIITCMLFKVKSNESIIHFPLFYS